LRGVDPPRRGNRHPGRAPQGVYRCAGEDRWVAISVSGEQEWQALCGAAELDDSLRTMDLAARLERHDAIDEALSIWTRASEPAALMARLQSIGVMACTVGDARDLVDDPQLAHDRFWVELDHADIGRRRFPGLPIHLGRTPATFRRAAPLLGEHNAEVLREILGLGAGEIKALKSAGVITDRPPKDAPLRGV
ncbi:CoA transferase, partial [Candidatus Sumerlaeota bacterium]|nr:CoA transferase [Candidatus Sumerlaeota bacterium]